MSNPVAQQKLLVEGLRIEAGAPRQRMSQTVKELVEFVRQHTPQDPLIVGIDKKSNQLH
jgi:ribosomal protein L31E